MDKQIQKLAPDYKRIYLDIIKKKFPHKKGECAAFFQKENLIAIDIINVNKQLFDDDKLNKQHRSYSENDILYILNYQKKESLNNIQVANHFELSRNTVSKWRKLYSRK